MSNATVTQEIAQALGEPNSGLIRRVVEAIGAARAMELLIQAQDVEAAGGLMTSDGSRRRTPGGVFFHLVRQSATPAENGLIWTQTKRRRRPVRKAPVIEPPSWVDALKLVMAVTKAAKAGEVRTVKVTLIGRPKQMARAKSCMVCVMEGRSVPKDMPKGLPMPPAEVKQSYVVFISDPAWERVEPQLKSDPADELIIEGWPYVDAQRGVITVLAQGVTTIALQREKRQAKPRGG
jgi:hypothetical protein